MILGMKEQIPLQRSERPSYAKDMTVQDHLRFALADKVMRTFRVSYGRCPVAKRS